jgi:hypothetical protein
VILDSSNQLIREPYHAKLGSTGTKEMTEMLTHPLQSEPLARSLIEDRRRVPAAPAVPSRALRRTTGTALVGAAVVLQRLGRSLQGADGRPVRVDVDLRPCS